MNRTRLILLAATFVLGIAASTLLSTTASASNAWNAYHWKSDHLSPTVKDGTASPSFWNVSGAVAEWRDLSAPIDPVMTSARRADVTVSEKNSVLWLGLAQIWVENGHITKGKVFLNPVLKRAPYTPAMADHVLCQEIGHILGLDHNRDGAVGGSPDDTCMNDVGHLGEYTSPNSHDVDQLNDIYNHSDLLASSVANRSGHAHQHGGEWVTVHVIPLP